MDIPQWPSEFRLMELNKSYTVAISWFALKDSFKSHGDKEIYTRWGERAIWVFNLVREVFDATHILHTDDDKMFSYEEYEKHIVEWQTILENAKKDPITDWSVVEQNRKNLIIRRVIDTQNNVVFQFPYASGLTSDMDIQFNLHLMSPKEFEYLKNSVIISCSNLCLSRHFDLNVYIEGDIANYPVLNLEECKKFLKSKLIRFQVMKKRKQNDLEIKRVENIYSRYYKASLKNEVVPLQQEYDLYVEYFSRWEVFNKNPTAKNLALFHYLKIEGYVCVATLKFILNMTQNADSEFYRVAALENLCDAVIHMSPNHKSFFDKSKYLKRCALALRSSICANNLSCEHAYSSRQHVLKSLLDIAESFDSLRQSVNKDDMKILEDVKSEGPFFISTCASVIKNLFTQILYPYRKLKTTLFNIL